MNLPKRYRSAFYFFSTALRREYGLTVGTKLYLRLLDEARAADKAPLKPPRQLVWLRLYGRQIPCVFDPMGDGALIGVVPAN